MQHEPDNGTERDERWSKVASAMRTAGVSHDCAGEEPPFGLVTRIVARAQADRRADETGLLRWRRWTVLGAGAAVVCFVVSFYALPGGSRDNQFVPVPALELPQDLTE